MKSRHKWITSTTLEMCLAGGYIHKQAPGGVAIPARGRIYTDGLMTTWRESASARRDQRQAKPVEDLGSKPAKPPPKHKKKFGVIQSYRGFRFGGEAKKLSTWTQWYATERARDDAFAAAPKGWLATLPEFSVTKVER